MRIHTSELGTIFAAAYLLGCATSLTSGARTNERRLVAAIHSAVIIGGTMPAVGHPYDLGREHVVVDSASLRNVGRLSASGVDDLKARFGNRVTIGVPAQAAACAVAPSRPCIAVKLVGANVDSGSATIRLSSWNVGVCGGSFGATFRIDVTPVPAEIIRVDDVDIGDCG